MLEGLFYISGIAVNIGFLVTLYKINIIYFPDEKTKSLIKKEEEGIGNLHSSQSVGNLCKMETQEDTIKERLRVAKHCNFLRNWINYIPGFASKND